MTEQQQVISVLQQVLEIKELEQKEEAEETDGPYAYQQQAERVLRETRKNLLVIAPTGAGKTESGFTGLELAGKGVYVAPTRALCHEKANWLRKRFPEARVVVGNKDYSLSVGDFRWAEIRVVTPWKLGVVLHNDHNFGQHCPMVILDEVHNLDPETELMVTKLSLLHPQVRKVGLSATVHEDDEPKLASWMDAVIIKSEERPVPLVTRVVHFDPDLNEWGEEVTRMRVRENGHPHPEIEEQDIWEKVGTVERLKAIIDMIRYEMQDRAPVLIYTPYRERARQIAEALAEIGFGGTDLEEAVSALPDEAGDFTDTLKSCLPRRVGLHHGGLTAQERELVFDLALAGKLDIVVTCQTLAQGINLPARHVIVESVYVEAEGGERRLMPVSNFWEIAGRAGRPQFDSIGYVWVPATSEIELAEIEEVLLKHKASKIVSRIYGEYFLTAHVAGLIQLGYSTPSKLVDFLRHTFFGRTLQDQQPLVEQFERIISRLVDEGFAMPIGNLLVLTDRGQRMARLGLHPDEYKVIESLIRRENAEYDDWVRGLAEVCGEYALRGKREPTEEEIEEVVSFGMTAYSLRTSWACRELVDYVNRLLELSSIYLGENFSPNVDESYRQAFRQQVADRFLFGELEFARKLARVLSRSAVKRVLRNFGPGLEYTDPETGERSPRRLDDSAVKTLAKVIWGQTGFPTDHALGGVAGVLGITEAKLRRLAKAALADQNETPEAEG